MVEELGFQMPEEALHNGIVQTATLSRHALHNAVVFCSLNDSSSLIVVPLVRMKERRLSFIRTRGTTIKEELSFRLQKTTALCRACRERVAVWTMPLWRASSGI